MIRFAGTHDISAITYEHLVPWITQPGSANNTIRARLACATQFYAWARRQGLTTNDPTAELEHLRKSYPKTYGKVQDANPARWLTAEEAFGSLIGACRDDTQRGVRDEIIVRLGLSGMRQAEIHRLRWLDVDQSARIIRWQGKGNKARSTVPGRTLLAVLAAWRQMWTDATGVQPDPHDTILRATRGGGTSTRIDWTKPANKWVVYNTVRSRAAAARLGHVAPHDLRRTAAGILHNTKAADGGHTFDRLDIQKVLGHASPETTQRSYLVPIDNGTTERAAEVLD